MLFAREDSMTSVKDYKLYVLQSSSKKETENEKEKEKQKER